MNYSYEDNPFLLFGELFPRLPKATLGDFIQAASRECRLNRTHMKTLLVLRYTGGTSMSQLGMKIGLEKGSVTSVVSSLTERTLVTRSRSGRDKRRIIVKLPPRGSDIAETYHTAVQEHIHRKLTVLDAPDQRAFYRSLARLDAVIKKVEQPGSEAE